MSKKKVQDPKNDQENSASKIEAIKNLIFGENIVQYDSEFETLKKDLQDKKAHLENYIDEVRNEIMQSIDSLTTDVNIRITDLEGTIDAKTNEFEEKKVDRIELGKLLISLGEKISS